MQRSLKRYGRRKISESLKVGTGSPQPEESDEMIIERVLDKDIDAYELLVRRYSRFVFGIVAVRVNRADVADVMQEVFVGAYRSLSRYRMNTAKSNSFRNWLGAIAIRRCCDHWRAIAHHLNYAMSGLNKEERIELETLLEEAAQASFQAEQSRWACEDMCTALEALRADDRRLVSLLYMSGHSAREVGALINMPPAHVRVRAHRACKTLRKRIVSDEHTTTLARINR